MRSSGWPQMVSTSCASSPAVFRLGSKDPVTDLSFTSYDNVGGELLDVALDNMKTFGRIGASLILFHSL